MAAPTPRPTVQLPRGALVALCAALVLALMAVAFLLGRQSARPAPPGLATVASPSSPAAGPVPQDPPAGVASVVPAPWSEATPGAPPGSPAPAGGTLAVEPDDESGAVAAYFGQIDRLEAASRSWSDPQQLALQIVQQGARGDQRGLDDLLATARQARESLRAVAVPPACRAHHAESLALMDAALDLLARLGPALSAQDFIALQGLASAAQELETRTKRLQALEADLRQRHGLPAAAR